MIKYVCMQCVYTDTVCVYTYLSLFSIINISGITIAISIVLTAWNINVVLLNSMAF